MEQLKKYCEVKNQKLTLKKRKNDKLNSVPYFFISKSKTAF